MRSKGASQGRKRQPAGDIRSFLVDAFYGQQQFTRDRLKPRLEAPAELDWDRYGKDQDKASAGCYTVNPALRDLDLAAARPVIETIPDSIRLRKSLVEVGKYAVKKFGRKYHLPGVEYWQLISERPREVDKRLRNGKIYFLFGSLLCHPLGGWYVPHAAWDGRRFYNNADWLGGIGMVSNQIVLLERAATAAC